MLVKVRKEEVPEFVRTATKFEEADLDLYKGSYGVDAKSILGVYTLDMSSPVNLVVSKVDNENLPGILQEFERFRA